MFDTRSNNSVDINYIMDLGYGYGSASVGSTQPLLLNVDLMIDKNRGAEFIRSFGTLKETPHSQWAIGFIDLLIDVRSRL